MPYENMIFFFHFQYKICVTDICHSFYHVACHLGKLKIKHDHLDFVQSTFAILHFTHQIRGLIRFCMV